MSKKPWHNLKLRAPSFNPMDVLMGRAEVPPQDLAGTEAPRTPERKSAKPAPVWHTAKIAWAQSYVTLLEVYLYACMQLHIENPTQLWNDMGGTIGNVHQRVQRIPDMDKFEPFLARLADDWARAGLSWPATPIATSAGEQVFSEPASALRAAHEYAENCHAAHVDAIIEQRQKAR